MNERNCAPAAAAARCYARRDAEISTAEAQRRRRGCFFSSTVKNACFSIGNRISPPPPPSFLTPSRERIFRAAAAAADRPRPPITNVLFFAAYGNCPFLDSLAFLLLIPRSSLDSYSPPPDPSLAEARRIMDPSEPEISRGV